MMQGAVESIKTNLSSLYPSYSNLRLTPYGSTEKGLLKPKLSTHESYEIVSTGWLSLPDGQRISVALLSCAPICTESASIPKTEASKVPTTPTSTVFDSTSVQRLIQRMKSVGEG